jgi:trimethylamine--corrinoid protein Co-methyltransferase
MRTGTTPMGAIETAMLDVACAQIGQYLNLPTHAYLGASDAKRVDAQAGMESAVSAVIGALAGINMISGAGMLDFLACHSIEKLVIDGEAISYAQRLLQGIEARTESLATAMFAAVGASGEFLKLEETRRLFRCEQSFPSAVIDRASLNPEGSSDAFERARTRVEELVASYVRPTMESGVEAHLHAFMEEQCERAGMRQRVRMAEFADVT